MHAGNLLAALSTKRQAFRHKHFNNFSVKCVVTRAITISDFLLARLSQPRFHNNNIIVVTTEIA